MIPTELTTQKVVTMIKEKNLQPYDMFSIDRMHGVSRVWVSLTIMSVMNNNTMFLVCEQDVEYKAE